MTELETVGWIALVAGTLVAGALAAAQTALAASNRESLRAMLPAGGQDPGRLIEAAVVAHVLVMLLVAADSGALAYRLGVRMGWPAYLAVPAAGGALITLLLAFGELGPRHLARSRPEAIARLAVGPLGVLAGLASPLLSAGAGVTRRALGVFGLRPVADSPVLTEDELKHFIRLGEREGVLERREGEMLQSVLSFADTLVKQVMVARTDMVCLDVDGELDTIVRAVIESGYSRIPMYRGHADNVVGILVAKDLLAIWDNRALLILQDVLHKPVFVPETMRLSDLLKEFQRGKMHLAIVVDEYGGTAGLVTLEDVLEEIVGEIRDEYDDESTPVVGEDGSIVVDARMELRRLRMLVPGVPEAPGIETIGGLLAAHVRGSAAPAAGVVAGSVRLIVEDADARRIGSIRVVPLGPVEHEPPTEKTEEVQVGVLEGSPSRRRSSGDRRAAKRLPSARGRSPRRKARPRKRTARAKRDGEIPAAEDARP